MNASEIDKHLLRYPLKKVIHCFLFGKHGRSEVHRYFTFEQPLLPTFTLLMTL